MKTVTQTVKAWIPDVSYVTPQDLFEGRIAGLHYTNNEMLSMGWTYAGEAEITVQLVDQETLVANKVEALKEEAKSIRAEAHQKCVRIEEQIQNLLAITYEPASDNAGA